MFVFSEVILKLEGCVHTYPYRTLGFTVMRFPLTPPPQEEQKMRCLYKTRWMAECP